MVNKGLMQRVFYNIAINAVKYGLPGGELTILISEDDSASKVVFDFCDTGVGVPAEEASRIFDPEFRGRGARGKCSGEGLGLSIAKEIVEAHDGDLVLLSPRDPTIFRIALPVVGHDASETGTFEHPGILRIDEAPRIA